MTDNTFCESYRLMPIGNLKSEHPARWVARKAAALVLLSLATAIVSRAQTYTTLATFDGTDGANPFATLVQGFNGSLYGITPTGGSSSGSSSCPFGCGTIFELAPSGQLTALYNFCSQVSCPDGELPYDGLTLSTNGNLYGTTAGGGASGNGTIFEVTPSGQLTTLHSFCSQANCTDGESSIAGLVEDNGGYLYGLTLHGGANNTCPGGCGTLFQLSPAGGFTTLYSFCSQPDCADGWAAQGIVLASDGSLYGATGAGGNDICTHGCGTIFAVDHRRKLTTLYTFCAQPACVDGTLPVGALIQASNGNLYGVTSYGGSHNSGVIYEITPGGEMTTLYSFCARNACADGASPNSGLVQGSDGNFYGTTDGGGTYGHGASFEITPTGELTPLYSFCRQSECTDGAYPFAGLMQASNGEFYGTTYGGGTDSSDCTSGCGAIFSLSTGLSSFVSTLPTSGRVGQSVIILGNNLAGSTDVSFNGTPATFTVISPTEIMARVPRGATSGTVTVTTNDLPLTNNAPFRVTPWWY